MIRIVAYTILLTLIAGIASSESVFANHCGMALAPARLVFGGKESSPGKWPWLVALFLIENDEYFCGGTLLSSKLVSTVNIYIFNKIISSSQRSKLF